MTDAAAKSTPKKLLKGWMLLCTTAVTLFLLFYGSFFVYAWVKENYGARLKEIGACIDSGGTWDDTQKICVKVS